jgi:hypothetical protein
MAIHLLYVYIEEGDGMSENALEEAVHDGNYVDLTLSNNMALVVSAKEMLDDYIALKGI